MKQLQKISIFILIFFMIIMPTTVFASNTENYNPDNISTNSPSILLMDAKTGNILYSKNAYEKRFPASTTKLMTAILTLENCKLTDTATVSHNAIYSIPVGYSHANLQEGEILTIEQLLNVLMIPSANDAAIVLAEHISGSVEEFSKLMNSKAKEIGCLNTHFVNPNGIHEDNHYSTAYDMALIGKYAMKFKDIMRIATVNQYTLPKTNMYNKDDRIFNATNGLINSNSEYYYKETTGLKTGYTNYAGYCIVTTAKKENVELLGSILGSESISKRYEDCIKLFDYGFNNYSYKTIVKKNDIIDTIEIDGATRETKKIDVIAKNNIDLLVKNTFKDDDIIKTINIKDNLKAPIEQNAVIGTISYKINEKIYSTDLIASSSALSSDFEVVIFRALLIFLILFILVMFLNNTNRPKKNVNYVSKKRKIKSKNGGNYKFTGLNEFL